MAALSFLEPELLAIDPATLARWQREEPELAEYAHYFERLATRREHVRSGEIEELLAMAGEPTNAFSGIHTALSDADMKLGTIVDSNGNSVELGQGNYLTYLHSPDRGVRQAAWETSSDAYLALRNTFAANYAGAVKRDVFYARARRYDSALEAALAPEAIPVGVLENLLAAVRKNFPTWQRYFRARARLLGIEQAHTWDISEYPLAAPGKVEPVHVSWEQGIDLIGRSLAPMGDEYVGITLQGIKDRWVDRLPNAGKTSGAFSSGWRGQHPFILMTWHDDLGSVSTLAHELGHSIHSYYAWQTQPIVYSEYSNFVAEVASNFNQALMGSYLLEHETDPNVIITTIEERMGNHLRYLFTMPILEMFEIDAHTQVEQGEALTAESMIEMLAGLYREGYGDAVALDHERNGITWARFPHLFQPFYVFQYATGIAAAAQLAAQVQREGAPAVERYTAFLKSGGSVYPVDALRTPGWTCSAPNQSTPPSPRWPAMSIGWSSCWTRWSSCGYRLSAIGLGVGPLVSPMHLGSSRNQQPIADSRRGRTDAHNNDRDVCRSGLPLGLPDRLEAASARERLSGLVQIVHKSLSLEYVNNGPSPRRWLAMELPLLMCEEADIPWQMWSRPEFEWPVTVMPAFEAVKCAERQSLALADELDWTATQAFHGESRTLSLRHEILACAEAAGLEMQRFTSDLDSGVAKGLVIEEAKRGGSS